jgi:hypothetical protein
MLHFAHRLWTNSVLFSNLLVLGVLVCRELEEDVVSVFPDHVPKLLLLAICALRVLVGPASSVFNYLDIQP